MTPRAARIQRRTGETTISVGVNVDGRGLGQIQTGQRFLDHLLTIFATHSLIDLRVRASGDLRHHVIEDIALTIGAALNKALGERTGIHRFGWALVPLEDARASASIDLARRPYSSLHIPLERLEIEGVAREDLLHFTRSLVHGLGATIHVVVEQGNNDHHRIEAAFKALAVALRQACSWDPRRRGVASSKGVL